MVQPYFTTKLQRKVMRRSRAAAQECSAHLEEKENRERRKGSASKVDTTVRGGMMKRILEKSDRRKGDRRGTVRRVLEQRIAERLKLPLKGTVVFMVGGKEDERDIVVRNISAYGAYFIADLRPDVSSKVTLILPLEEAGGSFQALAAVVRVEDDSDNRFGIAVTFETRPDSD